MTTEKQDTVFAWITGMVGQVIGLITFEGIVIPMLLAFMGGLLGYLGKEAGGRLVKRFFSKEKTEAGFKKK